MKLKVVMLTKDHEYAKRFMNMVMNRYEQELELSVFSQFDLAMKKVVQSKSDILLAEKELMEEGVELPQYCGLVYLVDKAGITTIDDNKAIMKYQKVEDIRTELMDVYAERVGNENIGMFSASGDCKILTFYSGAGGVGASTVAAACAEYIAKEKKEGVLYLNLEQTGYADQHFHAEGSQDFSKVLYALSINNAGSRIKMEGALRKTTSGVYYYAASPYALDMLELNDDMLDNLFFELRNMGMFKWIVVDADFNFSEQVYKQMNRSIKTIIVSDGSQAANNKTMRKIKSLEIVSEQKENFPLNRIFVLYNRFGSKSGQKMQETVFKTIGGINRIEVSINEELRQVMLNTKKEVFEAILQM